MEPTRPIVEINYDFENDNTGEWEYVMIGQEDKRGDDDEDGHDENESDDGDE